MITEEEFQSIRRAGFSGLEYSKEFKSHSGYSHNNLKYVGANADKNFEKDFIRARTVLAKG